MLKDRNTKDLALDVASYARQLKTIFFTCGHDGNYLNLEEDYAINKRGMPKIVDEPNNWMTAQSVPVFIEDIFRKVAGRDISVEEKSDVVKFFSKSVVLLEEVANAEGGAEGHKEFAKSIHDKVKNVLPNLKEILAGIKEPTFV